MIVGHAPRKSRSESVGVAAEIARSGTATAPNAATPSKRSIPRSAAAAIAGGSFVMPLMISSRRAISVGRNMPLTNCARHDPSSSVSMVSAAWARNALIATLMIGAGSTITAAEHRTRTRRARQRRDTTHAVADDDGPLEPGRVGDREHVVGERVDLVGAGRRFRHAAAAVPSEVECRDRMPSREVPELGREVGTVARPAVHEDDRRIAAAGRVEGERDPVPFDPLGHAGNVAAALA